jgi:glycosyltransferase involved in cell wall biosynthesis
MSDPEVSVCLTAFNRAGKIGKTIESVLEQEFGNFELVISDNASEDSTEDVCRAYEKQDKRIRYYRNDSNLGMPGNLNAGLRRCGAPLVANLHDGDIYRRDLLRKWKDALDRNPDTAFAFCQLSNIDGSSRGISNPDLPARLERNELLRYMLSDRACYGSPVWGTVMGRREIYESVGRFDDRFSWYSDVWMWMRLNHSYPVMYVQEPLISLLPHEADRSYAKLNWWHERIIMTMYEDAADLLHSGNAIAIARERKRMRRIRDRRWIRAVAHAVRRSMPDRAAEGLNILQNEDSVYLRTISRLLVPLVWWARVRGTQR